GEQSSAEQSHECSSSAPSRRVAPAAIGSALERGWTPSACDGFARAATAPSRRGEAFRAASSRLAASSPSWEGSATSAPGFQATAAASSRDGGGQAEDPSASGQEAAPASAIPEVKR